MTNPPKLKYLLFAVLCLSLTISLVSIFFSTSRVVTCSDDGAACGTTQNDAGLLHYDDVFISSSQIKTKREYEKVLNDTSSNPLKKNRAKTHEKYSNHTRISTTIKSPKRRKQPRRMLLGIFGTEMRMQDRQARHFIRRTYLDFYRVHHTDTPNRVCSLQDFAKRNRTIKKEECQLVYTFVFGGNPKGHSLEFNESYPITIDPLVDPSLRNTSYHEPDAIQLNVDESRDKFGKLQSVPNLRNVMAWYKFVASDWDGYFDYVTYTDAHVLLFPTVAWKDEDLFSEHNSHKSVYGGLPYNHSEGTILDPAHANSGYYFTRYVLLSMDLVKHVSSQTATVSPEGGPDKAIANMLRSYPEPITIIPFQGILPTSVPKKLPKKTLGHWLSERLAIWDRYKDPLVEYEDSEEVALIQASPVKTAGGIGRPPRLLMGIFSMESPTEEQRRDLVRRTYLRYYEHTNTPNRICALQEILNKSLASNELEDCQMAYTFVVGGNPNGTAELVDFNASYPILALNNQSNNNSDDRYDTVYLNIRENMKEGKSQTWLRYATAVILKDHYFDYIGKMDTDTLLYPDIFFKTTFNHLAVFPNNVRTYGGGPFVKTSPQEDHIALTYMGGRLYWMSPDLARYVTSPKCNRSALALHSEDQSMGNFVHSHPLPIRRIQMPFYCFEHPMKDVDQFRKHWDRYMRRNKQARNQTENAMSMIHSLQTSTGKVRTQLNRAVE